MPQTLSDDFNRTNSATISDGTHPWVERLDTGLSIDNNTLRLTTGLAAPAIAVWDASVGHVNQYAEATIAGTYAGGFLGLVLRYDATTDDGFSIEMADGFLKCIRVVGGGPNTGAGNDTTAWTPAVGEVWRAEIEGAGSATVIRIYIDGVLRNTWTTPKAGLAATFADTNVRVGLHLNSENNDTTQAWDNFKAGTLASPPVFLTAGAGALTATSGAALTPAIPAGTVAKELLIAHVFFDNNSDTPSTPTDWTLLRGPDDLPTPATNGRTWIFGKKAVGGDAAPAFGTPLVTIPRRARVYRFTGVRDDTVANMVGGFAFEGSAIATYTDVGVTTPEANCLAVNLVAQADDLPAAIAFTGESGGDWTEAIAEFTGTTGTPDTLLQLQTAPMAAAGTIDGGSQASGTAINRGITGFYIRPLVEAAVSRHTDRHVRSRGALINTSYY